MDSKSRFLTPHAADQLTFPEAVIVLDGKQRFQPLNLFLPYPTLG